MEIGIVWSTPAVAIFDVYPDSISERELFWNDFSLLFAKQHCVCVRECVSPWLSETQTIPLYIIRTQRLAEWSFSRVHNFSMKNRE